MGEFAAPEDQGLDYASRKDVERAALRLLRRLEDPCPDYSVTAHLSDLIGNAQNDGRKALTPSLLRSAYDRILERAGPEEPDSEKWVGGLAFFLAAADQTGLMDTLPKDAWREFRKVLEPWAGNTDTPSDPYPS